MSNVRDTTRPGGRSADRVVKQFLAELLRSEDWRRAPALVTYPFAAFVAVALLTVVVLILLGWPAPVWRGGLAVLLGCTASGLVRAALKRRVEPPGRTPPPEAVCVGFGGTGIPFSRTCPRCSTAPPPAAAAPPRTHTPRRWSRRSRW